jgi:hypothetical protein
MNDMTPPEEKLRAEAAAFKRKQDAERQRRHRAGTKTYPVQLDRIVVGQLIRAREIPPGASDADIGAEIANVVAADCSGRLRVTPALPPETIVDELVLRPAGPKAKGKHRRKNDPGRILTGAEKARVAAQIMAEEDRRRLDDEERAYSDWLWPAYDPARGLRLRKERLAREEAEKTEKTEALRAKIAAQPPQAPKARAFQPLGKSGISKKGGKPITNGFGAAPRGKSQADVVKPIKAKPKAADVKKFAKITPTDKGVHTLQATDAEIRSWYGGNDDEPLDR